MWRSLYFNRVKQEVFGGAVADLSGMPVEQRAAPGALPDLPRGYTDAGGKLKYTKVLGALVGNRAACSKKLVARVQAQLAPLANACRLRCVTQEGATWRCRRRWTDGDQSLLRYRLSFL